MINQKSHIVKSGVHVPIKPFYDITIQRSNGINKRKCRVGAFGEPIGFDYGPAETNIPFFRKCFLGNVIFWRVGRRWRASLVKLLAIGVSRTAQLGLGKWGHLR